MSRYRALGSAMVSFALVASVIGCGRSSRMKSAGHTEPIPTGSELKQVQGVSPPLGPRMPDTLSNGSPAP